MKNIITKFSLSCSLIILSVNAAGKNLDLRQCLCDLKSENLLVADFFTDNNSELDNSKANYKTGYSRFNLYSHIKSSDNFTINSHLKFQDIFNDYQVASRSIAATSSADSNSRNNYFKIKELNLAYDFKKFTLTVGKFSANFGKAWKFDQGIWLNDMASNYMADEKLGATINTKLGDKQKTGEYNFGFSFFANNGSNLDNSSDVLRDSNYNYQSHLSNKKSPSSYLAFVDILYDFGNDEKLSYHFSHISLAPSQRFLNGTKISNQRAWSFGGNYQYPLIKEVGLDGLIEYTKVDNVGGNPYVRDNYLIADLVSNIYQNYNITLGYGRHKNVIFNARNGFSQEFFEISAGYKFNQTKFYDKLLIQIGCKEIRTNYKVRLEKWRDYGVRLAYVKNF